MRAAWKKPYYHDHPLLGRGWSVFCDGTHAHPHPRVTRALDRKWHRLWDLSQLSGRRGPKPLVHFERLRAKRALSRMGATDPNRAEYEQATAEQHQALKAALLHCACGEVMTHESPDPKSPDPRRRRLHTFYCNNPADRERQLRRRFFRNDGREVPNPSGKGQGMLGRHAVGAVPKGAKFCPVCKSELRYPRNVFNINGVEYDPPLLGLTCKNSDVDHSPRVRRELRQRVGLRSIPLPAGSRHGLTFYWSRKRSRFVEPPPKALKKGHPVRNCKVHGRMRVKTFTTIAGVPKGIFAKLGSTFPLFRPRCRFGDREVWISSDLKKEVWRTPQPRPGWRGDEQPEALSRAQE
jgi:hypothetical protein